MITALDRAAFDRGTDPLLEILTAEQAERILTWQPDSVLADRVEELSVKANEGDLTTAERAEYEGYIQANDFIAVLQAKARKLLAERRVG